MGVVAPGEKKSAVKCIAVINSYLIGTNESSLTFPCAPGTGPDIGREPAHIFFHLLRVVTFYTFAGF